MEQNKKANLKDFKFYKDLDPIFEEEIMKELTAEELNEAIGIYNKFMKIYEEEGIEGINRLDEISLSGILGGAAGFLVGPSVGKIIANALGVHKGVLYDMFTSKLVGVALGSAITKAIKNKR